MRNIHLKAATALLGVAIAGAVSPVQAGSGSVTLIQTGDIHGHLLPRPNLRSDATGRYLEGGMARMYTQIKALRSEATYADCKSKTCKSYDHSLLINTGDTVQGSGEALFSRGQAMIDVLNMFGYVAHAPGNWDFLYGPARFEETFKGTATTPPLANWNALAANLYYTNQFDDTAVCGATATDPATGIVRPLMRVLPAYSIKQVGNVKVGILGMTTARAIAAVGTSVTKNYMFADGKTEVPCYVNRLRNVEKVDVVVMISELEMARDIQIAETLSPAPDVMLNSDMHERTIAPIVAVNPDGRKTLIVEQGQDGTIVGKMKLNVTNGAITSWEFKQNVITSDIIPNLAVAAKIVSVRKPFVRGTFVPGQTVTVGGNTTQLMRPIDEVIAYTQVGLHRSNFVDEDMPGVVEGSSHDLIADAMANIGQAQSASMRGFRYGTHVAVGGAITMNDIYHYIPIAAKLGRTNKACGADLKFAIEQSIGGTFHPDPANWTGGWMFGYSGVSYDVDACDGFMGATPINPTVLTFADPTRPWSTNRGSNIKVNGVAMDDHELYDNRTTSATFQQCLPSDGSPAHAGYEVTGYWYADDPTTINNCNPCRGRNIQVVKTDGSIVQVSGPGVVAGTPLPNSLDVMDISEAVVKYLQGPKINGLVTANNLPIHRLTVKRLPTINPPGYNFRMIQPLKGASSATCPVI
ncbi:bifunctional metallophosphatase/5'-nucleotidase [Sulfurirhabdus autotrophica]|uniref:2',3'-cyclic-nucleotide 2'-phosphodiesterase (5'-nucleotidase family) n=1 Tax=Sulfurirhabdus autotrophica TaxID=1706046 RepID=A0A4R3YAR6_9PROT|nr:5'-nucleotidase C-terminal domain-containing protein [Sulfurirhabdus autotrophica]TCV89046.1 2',3'-cyclic-nucleotide 2'-phosphodiesterase (5'-nucleotidase family) [Sulfurirhabdus autotrophica]